MDNLSERNALVKNRLYGISDMTFTNFSLSWQDADDETNKSAIYKISDCTDSTLLTATCPVLSNSSPGKNIGWYIKLSSS